MVLEFRPGAQYLYASQNPVTHLDPTGLFDPDDPRYASRVPANVKPGPEIRPSPTDWLDKGNPNTVWHHVRPEDGSGSSTDGAC